MKLVVGKAPSESLALTNCVAVNPKDFKENIKHVLVKQQFAFSIKRTDQVPAGTIACSGLQRQWALLSLNEEVEVSFFDPSSEGPNYLLSKLVIETDLMSRTKRIDEVFDASEMAAVFLKSYDGLVFSSQQLLAFDFHGVSLKGTVSSFEIFDPNMIGSKKTDSRVPTFRGVLNSKTAISFVKAAGAPFEMSGKDGMAPGIVNPDFRFEDLGIGGLNSQFHAIFRRAFASRIFPSQLVNKLGIKHVRGILLYGPPGTGKTLMARQIGKMLKAKEPKIVNGPEILNKFVGQSEENIRKLFADAEDEYKKRGDNSDLHIIIFDELDAICKQRGSKNDGTGVGDSVVNQLLAKMDGVEQLNNILVIGMTNRKDMIDEALLRPGRMEVQIEISLPDQKGRFEILKIHTSKMRQNNLMGNDVNLEYLSEATKNFSGAEIEGLVKSATSFAFNRHIEGGTVAKVADSANKLTVGAADFQEALKEVIPAFGVSETEFEGTMLNGIIDYGPSIERILNSGQLFVKQVETSQRTPLITLLLHGPPGAGTTSLAARIALNSKFPFIKLISPENYVGMNESSKATAIAKVFENSYRSPLSVIVVDSIEKLLEYVPIGPRFSNIVLQTLLVLLKKVPPPGHRLLVVCTSSRRNILEEMGMSDCFGGELYVPNIQTVDEVLSVIKLLNVFPDKQTFEKCAQILTSLGSERNLSIGVKKLLMLLEMARQDEGRELEKFIDSIQDSLER